MAVAILAPTRIQDQADFGSTPGAGNSGYSVTWNNSSGKFELTNVSGSGSVSSVFGRTGAVVAASGDYTAAQVTNAAAVNAANTFTAAQTFNADILASKGLGGHRFFVGGAGNNTMIGDFQVLIGAGAGASITTGSAIVALGANAANAITNSSDVVAIGDSTLMVATTGGQVAIGTRALLATTSAPDGTGVGKDTLRSQTTGSAVGGNTAIGSNALFNLTTGWYCTAIGIDTLRTLTTSTRMTGVGVEAGRNATGSLCVFLGYRAGRDEIGSNKLYLSNSETTKPLVYGEFDNGIIKFHSTINTDTVTNTLSLIKRRSSGTPGAGLGAALRFALHSSTTEEQEAARIAALWNVATHASAVADLVAEAYYNAGGASFTASEIWRGRAGASPLIGFLGATPVARQTHIADPSGGGTQDAEARTAINAILDVLEAFGLVATS